MILMGEDDDWTPAPPCHELGSCFPDEITLVTYPGTYHDFDAPNRPVKIREGAATSATGQAHVGTSGPRLRGTWRAAARTSSMNAATAPFGLARSWMAVENPP